MDWFYKLTNECFVDSLILVPTVYASSQTADYDIVSRTSSRMYYSILILKTHNYSGRDCSCLLQTSSCSMELKEVCNKHEQSLREVCYLRGSCFCSFEMDACLCTKHSRNRIEYRLSKA